MDALEASSFLRAAADGKAGHPVPAEITDLVLLSPFAIQIQGILQDDVILRLSDNLIAGRNLELRAPIYALLHTAANMAKGSQRHPEAKRLFERILLHIPGDYNVRACLFEYYNADGKPVAACEILEPALKVMLAKRDVYSKYIEDYIALQFRNGKPLKALKTASAHLFDLPDWKTKTIRERVCALKQLYPSKMNGLFLSIEEFALSLDGKVTEFDALEAISHHKKRSRKKVNPRTVEAAFKILAFSAGKGWTRTYRRTVDLIVRDLLDKADQALLRKVFRDAGIPADLQQSLQAYLAGRFAAAGGLPPLNGDMNTSQMIEHWKRLFHSGEFVRLNTLVPVTHDASADPAAIDDLSRCARALSWPAKTDEKDGTPSAGIWSYITWQSGNEQLFRIVHNFTGARHRCVVSIGGEKLPEDIDQTTALLLAGNVHFLFRPVVTWGGQKLLFHNLFEVIDAFDKAAGEMDWLQVLCNRTYPLLSGDAAGRKLYNSAILHQTDPVIPFFAWSSEWPKDVVEQLPDVFNTALDDIFREADTEHYRVLACRPYSLSPGAFNFSEKPEVFETGFKASNHNYSLSPFGLDIRWMSFARMTEFVDTATENGTTYARRLHPTVFRWVHSVLKGHDLRTGSPFVTFNKKYAHTILYDPRATELFSAMNLSFGPEMNFFDTVRNTKHYDLEWDMGQMYYRNAEYVATGKYIKEAEEACDYGGKMLVRKTVPEGADFVDYFAEKNALELGDGAYFYAQTEPLVAANSHVVPSVDDIIALLLDQKMRMRDLHGKVIHDDAVLCANGKILDANREGLGYWSKADKGLRLVFDDGVYGEKFYRLFSANSRSLILPPAEIVSLRNRWSLFLEWPLSGLSSTGPVSEVLATPGLDVGATCDWHVAPVADIAMISAMEKQNLTDTPPSVMRVAGTLVAARKLGDDCLALIEVQGAPTLLKLDRVAKTSESAIRVFSPVTTSEAEGWNNASQLSAVNLTRTPDAFHGELRVRVLESEQVYRAEPDGRILAATDNDTAVAGRWLVHNHQLWIFGLKDLAIAKVSQTGFTCETVTLCGWGIKNFKDLTTFYATLSH
jgi:hypothetical protein